jgi:hypothetical protein
MHCSIVGTCLSTIELHKIIAKVKGHDLKGFSDLAIHEEAVLVAGHQGAASRLLQKALDRRHEMTIKRFIRAQNVNEVRGLWDDARRNGDIPGAYWALLTHPATTQELRQAAFADVHMLSHLVGAANRADIRRLATLETERAELALKVEKQEAQLRDAIVTRDATIRRLNDVLAGTIAHERSAYPSARPRRIPTKSRPCASWLQSCSDASQPKYGGASVQNNGTRWCRQPSQKPTTRWAPLVMKPNTCVKSWTRPKRSSRAQQAPTPRICAPGRPTLRAFGCSTSVGGRGRFLVSERSLRRHRVSISTTMAVWKNGGDCSPVWWAVRTQSSSLLIASAMRHLEV